MYSQFFGNYLLNKNIITPNDLVTAIKHVSPTKLDLEIKAIFAGVLSSSDIEFTRIIMRNNNISFKEAILSEGLLTEDKILELESASVPDYLFIAQSLLNDGVIDIHCLEQNIIEYQSEDEMIDLDIFLEQRDNLDSLLSNISIIEGFTLPEYIGNYIHLLFLNLIQFIGEDFTPLNFFPCNEYPVSYCASQKLSGNHSLTVYLDMEEDVAIEFSSRYVGDDFYEFNEYVKASLEDFLNLNNGLYNVNLSNEMSIEMELEAPLIHEDSLISQKEGKKLYLLPIAYPFGTINFIFDIT